MKGKLLSRVWLLVTPWTAAYQAPPSMDFPGKSTGVGAIAFSDISCTQCDCCHHSFIYLPIQYIYHIHVLCQNLHKYWGYKCEETQLLPFCSFCSSRSNWEEETHSFREETRDWCEFNWPCSQHCTCILLFTFITLEVWVHNNLKICMKKLRLGAMISS